MTGNIIRTGFILIALFFLVFLLKNKSTKYMLFANTKVVATNDDYEILRKETLKISDIELNSLVNYIHSSNEAINNLFSSININSKPKIIIDDGNCNGLTYTELSVINLSYNTTCLPPVIHELIHNKLGAFKEFWLSEGVAVFYANNVKRNNATLRKYVDSQDDYLNKYKCISENKDYGICAFSKYITREDLINLFDINAYDLEYSELGEDVYLYYALAGSFVEKLSNAIGEPLFLDYILSDTKNHILLKEYLSTKARDINIDDVYSEWVNNLYL